MISCNPKNENVNQKDTGTEASVTNSGFGKMEDGTAIALYTLTNSNGLSMQVMNYGGIIVSLKVPDKDGNMDDIVLGYDSLQPYVQNNPYFGALIGRYGNRIAKGKFSLDGKTYSLDQNNFGNHLHGGSHGFDKRVWAIREEDSPKGVALKLTYRSPDGEEGYPGNLEATVIYTLTDDNTLEIDYRATTDEKTIVNLTNHAYFNLGGTRSPDILSHELMIDADHIIPVDKTLIPSGPFMPVKGTPFDFTSPVAIGKRIDDDHEQIRYGIGYDHCWVLNPATDSLRLAATLYEPQSGRRMEVFTTEPGIQFYSGNFLDGSLTGKSGSVYRHRSGLCLETQHFPDSPNRNDYPSVVLNPGEEYKSKTIYAFSVK